MRRRHVVGAQGVLTALAMSALAAICLPAFAQAPRGSRTADVIRPPWPSDRTPVQLRIPPEYAFEQEWGPAGGRAVVRLSHPGMLPFRDRPGCGSGCASPVLVVVRTGEDSDLHRKVWRLLHGPAPSPAGLRYARNAIAPPAGFTEAWEETLSGEPQALMHLSRRNLVYLRAAPDGTPQELVFCRLAQRRPRCSVETTLEGQPAVQVIYSYALDLWPEHHVIRAALMRRLRDWL